MLIFIYLIGVDVHGGQRPDYPFSIKLDNYIVSGLTVRCLQFHFIRIPKNKLNMIWLFSSSSSGSHVHGGGGLISSHLICSPCPLYCEAQLAVHNLWIILYSNHCPWHELNVRVDFCVLDTIGQSGCLVGSCAPVMRLCKTIYGHSFRFSK